MNITFTPFFRKFTVGLLAISLFATAEISEATILYEQSVIDPVDGYETDTGSGTPLYADYFNISHSSLESIVWWGAYLAEDTDDFAIKLYSDLGGTGTVFKDFGSVSFVRGSPLFDSTLPDAITYYQYQFDLSTPLELQTNNYYLSIQNQGISSWAWLFGNPGNGSVASLTPGDANWSSAQGDMAFRLDGSPIRTVPEPSTLFLMLLSGSLFMMSGKFRRV